MYDLNDICVLDLESDGLLDTITKIHCLVTHGKGETKKWHNSPLLPRNGTLQEGLVYLDTFDYICGHNIIGFDLPALVKLCNWTPKTQILDTFILSQLLYANEAQTHGLDEWGKKLGVLKPKHTEWSIFNEDMLHRCTEDVKINTKLLQKCLEELNIWDWSKAIKLEQEVYRIYTEQSTVWRLDTKLLDVKIQEYNDLYNKIYDSLKVLKKTMVIKGEETCIKRYTGIIIKNNKKHRQYKKYPYCKVTFTPFAPSSNTQLVKFLLEKGWRPEKFTPKGRASLRDDPLKGIPKEIADVLNDFKDAIHRKGVLEGFKKRVKPDGSINMFAYTCGTNTARFRHSIVANIQPEFKDLFICKDGYKLIGCDASQLEAKIEGHFTTPYDKGAYANYLLNMDVHQFNADMWGTTRDKAKAPFYAMCVPEDTQILTKTGWKFYKDLIIGELVLTYNQQTNLKEWKPLQNIITMSGEVFKFGNNHKTFKATNEHKWFIKRYKHTKKHGRVDPQILTKLTKELNSEDLLLMNAPFNQDQDKENFDYDIINNQKYKTNWSEIILKMSHQQRKSWLNAFLLAEGTNRYREKKCNEWSWVQNKTEIAEAAILCSYLVQPGQIHITNKKGTNFEMYNVNLGYKQYITCQNFIKKSLGIQKVWCPQTENGSWVMRQGNVITLTGNSYGCGASKIASMLNISDQQGKDIIETHYETWKGLNLFIKEIEKALDNRGFIKKNRWGKKDLDEDKKPWVKGIDGRKLYVRGMHKLKNTIIQSAGAIVTKLWYIFVAKLIKELDIDAKIVMYYHDELIIEYKCDKDKEKLLTDGVESAILKSGAYFKLRIPLEGKAKIGNNWKEVK